MVQEKKKKAQGWACWERRASSRVWAWGSESSFSPLKPGEKQTFWLRYPGFSLGHPGPLGCSKSLRKIDGARSSALATPNDASFVRSQQEGACLGGHTLWGGGGLWPPSGNPRLRTPTLRTLSQSPSLLQNLLRNPYQTAKTTHHPHQNRRWTSKVQSWGWCVFCSSLRNEKSAQRGSPKTSVRPSKSWKKKHFGMDIPRGRPWNFGLINFGLIFRSLFSEVATIRTPPLRNTTCKGRCH